MEPSVQFGEPRASSTSSRSSSKRMSSKRMSSKSATSMAEDSANQSSPMMNLFDSPSDVKENTERKSSRRVSTTTQSPNMFGDMTDTPQEDSNVTRKSSSHKRTSSSQRQSNRSAENENKEHDWDSQKQSLDTGGDLFGNASDATTNQEAASESVPTVDDQSDVAEAAAASTTGIAAASGFTAATTFSQQDGPTLWQQMTSFFQNSENRTRQAISNSNQADVDMGDIMSRTSKLGHEYVIVFFVLKLFLLVCLMGYTAGIDEETCPCADDNRKAIILWGGGVVVAFSVLAVFFPDLYTTYPSLKAVLMTSTFLVLYSVITYFPLLRESGCDCAPEDWRRTVVESVTYIVLAIFVLSLLGVVAV